MSEALFGSRFFVFLITLYADVNERVPRHFVNQFFLFAPLLARWWTQQDSNLRPPPYQGGALTN
jgi:hypothetical protein